MGKHKEMTRIVETANQLLESADSYVLYRNPYDKDEVLHLSDVLEGIEDERMRRICAIVCQNILKHEFNALDESTKIANLGSFEKWAFSMVTAVLPSMQANKFVSMQPMQGPHSQIFHQKYVYNTSKGSAVAGTDVFANSNRYYSSQVIDEENQGTGDNSTTNFTGTLAYLPVKPGTVVITATDTSTLTVNDDGNQNLTGDVGVGTNTINYTTGAFDVTFSGAPDTGTAINISYAYDNEGDPNVQTPEVDLSITSSSVSALTRALKILWSMEAEQDYKAQYGRNTEQDLLAGIVAQIRAEIDSEIVYDIYSQAGSTRTAWSTTPGQGVSETDHRQAFKFELDHGQFDIRQASGKGRGNFVICGYNVAAYCKSLNGFVPKILPAVGDNGIVDLGSINGEYNVFLDPNMGNNNYMMGHYSGHAMQNVGYIYAPFVPIYMTPTVYLADRVGQKGIGTRYGKKMVDRKFYLRSSIS